MNPVYWIWILDFWILGSLKPKKWILHQDLLLSQIIPRKLNFGLSTLELSWICTWQNNRNSIYVCPSVYMFHIWIVCSFHKCTCAWETGEVDFGFFNVRTFWIALLSVYQFINPIISTTTGEGRDNFAVLGKKLSLRAFNYHMRIVWRYSPLSFMKFE